MIDIERETLVPLGDLPKWIGRRGGKRPHQATVYRWALRGVRGIRLEVVRIGGRMHTSVEAFARFCSRQDQPQDQSTSQPPTTAQRKKQIEHASRRVDEILGR